MSSDCKSETIESIEHKTSLNPYKFSSFIDAQQIKDSQAIPITGSKLIKGVFWKNPLIKDKDSKKILGVNEKLVHVSVLPEGITDCLESPFSNMLKKFSNSK